MIAQQIPIALTGAGLIVQAPAKLNLYLDVQARRDDGYHDLETLIAPINLCDTLRLTPSRDNDHGILLRVHDCSGGGAARHLIDQPIPTDDRNLVVKALKALQAALGVTSGVTVDLWKRIPSRAGLGGGSSDAAAALHAGARLWNPSMPNHELRGIAASLGSDVPVMLGGKTALCRGRGELLEPISLPTGLPCVLVQPPIGLGAAEVFAEFRPGEHLPCDSGRLARLVSALRAGRLCEAGRLMINTLQSPAERLTPWIARLRQVFETLPIAAHQMSGSGSVYFGLCQSRRQAMGIAAQLRQRLLGSWVGIAATC